VSAAPGSVEAHAKAKAYLDADNYRGAITTGSQWAFTVEPPPGCSRCTTGNAWLRSLAAGIPATPAIARKVVELLEQATRGPEVKTIGAAADPSQPPRTKLTNDAAYAATAGASAGGVQVPNVATPMPPAQALGSLLAAGCPQSALLMVAAQSAVETAEWGSMRGWTNGFHNFNFGNVTPSAAQLAAGIRWMNQNVPGMKYIAYADPISGAKGMLGWLSAHGLLAPAAAGDLTGYMAQLRAGCYLGCIGLTDPTGHTISQTDYDNYQAGISTWMSKLSGVVPAPPQLGSSVGRNVAILAAILTAGGLAAWLTRRHVLGLPLLPAWR
jgi:hypothetical protein